MTGWNLPPGCTDADIDRAFGGDEECYHEEFEINYEGRAHCDRCGETWWASNADIEHQRYCNEQYDVYCREEERKQWWRDQWARIWHPVLKITFPARDAVSTWLWKRGWRRSVRRLESVHDEIPF